MILCGGVYNPYHICNENTFKNMYLPLGFLTLSLGVFHKYLLNEYWVMDLHRMKKHVENPWEKSAKPKTEEIWLMTTSVLDSQLCVTLKLSAPQNFVSGARVCTSVGHGVKYVSSEITGSKVGRTAHPDIPSHRYEAFPLTRLATRAATNTHPTWRGLCRWPPPSHFLFLDYISQHPL